MQKPLRMMNYLRREPFRLSGNDAIRLRYCMQGILYRPDVVPSEFQRELVAGVEIARNSFMEIRDQFGVDPCDTEAPADRAFEYDDLMEKLAALSESDARHLYFFMVGYLAAWGEDG